MAEILKLIAPFLKWLADDAAVRSSGSATLDLTKENRSPKKGGRPTDGTTEVHPAHGLSAGSVVHQVAFDLDRILPDGFDVDVAFLDIDLDPLAQR